MTPIRGLSLDAAGTVLHPVEPIAVTYRRFAAAHGDAPAVDVIATRLRAVMREAAPLRTTPDWRGYWARVVAESTGCDASGLLDALYEHYAAPEAWRVASGAEAVARTFRAHGGRVAILSNWDLRLRPLLDALGVSAWIDLAVISAEEGIEKPDPEIFRRMCTRLGLPPAEVLHVGDSSHHDVDAARAAGLRARQFGADVPSFAALGRELAASSSGSTAS